MSSILRLRLSAVSCHTSIALGAVLVLCMARVAPGFADQERVDGDLKVGRLAPDFSLEPRAGGAPVTLSSFRGKSPVALVFGSYT